jgi:hypothetical protein
MRTTRLSLLLPFAALVALPTMAAANCYSIYDAQNRLSFQSTIAPIDLSTRISDSMRARFPGSFLVILPDDSDCREFRSGPTISPRFDSGTGSGMGSANDPKETLEPPLLSGARAPGDTAASRNAIATREAARSGNALNIKRSGTP